MVKIQSGSEVVVQSSQSKLVFVYHKNGVLATDPYSLFVMKSVHDSRFMHLVLFADFDPSG